LKKRVSIIDKTPHGKSFKEFVDHGVSGATGRDRRPADDRVYTVIVRRKIDLLMAWSVDRLGRSLQRLMAVLPGLQTKEGNLYLHQQGIDTTIPVGTAHVSETAFLDSLCMTTY